MKNFKSPSSPPISQILPELDRICSEHGLEKKAVAHRFCGPREHGYLKAYEIFKERRAAQCN